MLSPACDTGFDLSTPAVSCDHSPNSSLSGSYALAPYLSGFALPVLLPPGPTCLWPLVNLLQTQARSSKDLDEVLERVGRHTY